MCALVGRLRWCQQVLWESSLVCLSAGVLRGGVSHLLPQCLSECSLDLYDVVVVDRKVCTVDCYLESEIASGARVMSGVLVGADSCLAKFLIEEDGVRDIGRVVVGRSTRRARRSVWAPRRSGVGLQWSRWELLHLCRGRWRLVYRGGLLLVVWSG